VRQLQPQAVAAWWQQGHPGWAIYPVDSEQFLTTGALDAAALPLPSEQLGNGGGPALPALPASLAQPAPAFAPAPVPSPPVPPMPSAAAAAAALNPALASAFIGAGAGGMSNDALLQAMSPFLHGGEARPPLAAQPGAARASSSVRCTLVRP
jgi:hypothetical protein